MSTYVGNTLVAGSTCSPTLLDYKWADHLLNDISWLRADTFSWQNGDIYEAVYNHLVADCADKEGTSETIAGITIWYVLADDGHKICPASEEANVRALYNKTGNAWYYILDTANKQFKLPYKHSQQIVQSIKNADGSWYRLYADGWVEQGGGITTPNSLNVTFNLPIEMATNKYSIIGNCNVYSNTSGHFTPVSSTTTSFVANCGAVDSLYGIGWWQVKGQSALDMSKYQSNEKHLYFYVGNFTKTALENTAGATTESINDINMHKVIAFQAPTGQYLEWYRKYADGWVEQGGFIAATSCAGASTTQLEEPTFAIPLRDQNYEFQFTFIRSGSYWSWVECAGFKIDNTKVHFELYNNNSNKWTGAIGNGVYWSVRGMAA